MILLDDEDEREECHYAELARAVIMTALDDHAIWVWHRKQTIAQDAKWGRSAASRFFVSASHKQIRFHWCALAGWEEQTVVGWYRKLDSIAKKANERVCMKRLKRSQRNGVIVNEGMESDGKDSN